MATPRALLEIVEPTRVARAPVTYRKMVGRRATVAVAAAAVVALAAACRFSSPLDDEGGFLGPAPTIDGSIRPSDATFEDDAADATPSDGQTTPAFDARVDAIADAGRPCEASFCDDFDDGPLGAMWTKVHQPSAAGTLALTDAGRSEPFALSATTSGGALQYRNVELAKLLGDAKTVTCSFAVKPIERPGRPAVFFLRGLTSASETWQAWIALAPNETTLGLVIFSKDGGVPFEAIESASAAPLDQWTDLALTTDLGKLALRVGDASPVELSIDGGLAGTGMSAHVGIQVIETTQEKVLLDDVRCTVTN